MTMQRCSVRMCSRTNFTMFRPVSPSSEAVGSSRIKISGRLTMARAMATRCCSPPLSFTGGSSRAILQTDDLQILCGLLERLIPVALLQNERNRHVLGRGQAREEMEVLEDKADLVQPELRECIVATGSRSRCPRSSPCRVRAQNPRNHAQHASSCRCRMGRRHRGSRQSRLRSSHPSPRGSWPRPRRTIY